MYVEIISVWYFMKAKLFYGGHSRLVEEQINNYLEEFNVDKLDNVIIKCRYDPSGKIGFTVFFTHDSPKINMRRARGE